MKALTVRQPWAWAIARGHKTIENRTWTTTHRGRFAIHAGTRWDHSDAARSARDFLFTSGFPGAPDDDPPVSSTGLVIATVDLVDICRAALDGKPCDCGRGWAMRDHAHWRLADVELLAEPVPARGRLGLWEWTP